MSPWEHLHLQTIAKGNLRNWRHDGSTSGWAWVLKVSHQEGVSCTLQPLQPSASSIFSSLPGVAAFRRLTGKGRPTQCLGSACSQARACFFHYEPDRRSLLGLRQLTLSALGKAGLRKKEEYPDCSVNSLGQVGVEWAGRAEVSSAPCGSPGRVERRWAGRAEVSGALPRPSGVTGLEA